MNYSEQIKNHIAKGESDKAIKLLLKYTKEQRPKSHDEALLLSGQYRQWKREITLGVESSSNELRRIEMSVMDILNDTDTYESTPPRINKLTATSNIATTKASTQKSNLTFILLGVFGTISAAFLLMLAFSPDEPVLVENNIIETPELIEMESVDAPETKPEKTVFGSGLTESQFDNALSSYQENTGGLDPARFDINMVIQVRYTNGESEGFFESVAGTIEWIERGAEVDDIKARYTEVNRKDRTITLQDVDRDRKRYLSIDDDKVYEQVETFQKMHVFNIIGVY